MGSGVVKDDPLLLAEVVTYFGQVQDINEGNSHQIADQDARNSHAESLDHEHAQNLARQRTDSRNGADLPNIVTAVINGIHHDFFNNNQRSQLASDSRK